MSRTPPNDEEIHMPDMSDDWRGESFIRCPVVEKEEPAVTLKTKRELIAERRDRLVKMARAGKTISEMCEAEDVSATRVKDDLKWMGVRAVDTRYKKKKVGGK